MGRERINHSPMIMARAKGDGRVVVITGVARGLGRAMALEFAARGHHVVGCSRNEKRLLKLEKELGDPHSFAMVDVTDDDAVAVWAEEAVAEFGPPDLLLNNAAVINKSKFLWELPDVVLHESNQRFLAATIPVIACQNNHCRLYSKTPKTPPGEQLQ